MRRQGIELNDASVVVPARLEPAWVAFTLGERVVKGPSLQRASGTTDCWISDRWMVYDGVVTGISICSVDWIELGFVSTNIVIGPVCRMLQVRVTVEAGGEWRGAIELGEPEMVRVSVGSLRRQKIAPLEPHQVLLDFGKGDGWRTGPLLTRDGDRRLVTVPWLFSTEQTIHRLVLVSADYHQVSLPMTCEFQVGPQQALQLSFVSTPGLTEYWRDHNWALGKGGAM